MELLLEGDWLQGGEPAPDVVDNWDGLRLCRGQTCKQRGVFFSFVGFDELTGGGVLLMRSEDSPRLITPGREAMMRLCVEAGEADRLCRDVRVLTGGSGPPLETCGRRL